MKLGARGEVTKLGVFIGSPKRGLENIREALIRAVLEAGHSPDGMELWTADGRPTQQTILDKLALCDLHVLILGDRYGEVIEPLGSSYTEWEFRQSCDAKRPIVAFMLDESACDQAWNLQPPPEDEQRRYLKFRGEVRSRSVCKMYGDPQMPRITQDLTNAINEVIDSGQLRPLAGWIRAESESAKLANALRDNAFLMRIMGRVVGFQTPGSRFDKERHAKSAAAMTFWDAMANCMLRKDCSRIFLESGSSLAYVSEVLEARARPDHRWRISTNNALALLQLLLFHNGDVLRLPSFAPDPQDPYGAIFTPTCLDAHEEPPRLPRPLFPRELDAINELKQLLTDHLGPQIIFSTASGWDTTHDIEGFRGPHVGSHPNMLVKRALFMAGLPVVLFLTRHKVDPRFPEARFKAVGDPGALEGVTRYCYPVFGAELPLQIAMKQTPVALCVGYDRGADDGSLQEVAKRLKSIIVEALAPVSFDVNYANKECPIDGKPAGAFIAANDLFRERFPR